MSTKKRKRVHPKLSDKKLVDQSQKNMCDINCIMDRYKKTGMLPQFKEKFPMFIDNTGVKSVEEAHQLVNEANYLFEQIPAKVRKLMDNNPANLIDFVNNPENFDICLEYGLIEAGLIKAKEVTPSKPQPKAEKNTVDTKETVNSQGA